MTSPIANVASLAARAGEKVVRQVRSAVAPSGARPDGADRTVSGWLVVTVFCELSDVDTAKLPAPLAELGDRIEVRAETAPAGKGTELAARLRDASPPDSQADRLTGGDAQADLRSALRRAKQLIEVGEVLTVDPAPHGERKATPAGLLLETWTKVAPKGGVR